MPFVGRGHLPRGPKNPTLNNKQQQQQQQQQHMMVGVTIIIASLSEIAIVPFVARFCFRFLTTVLATVAENEVLGVLSV